MGRGAIDGGRRERSVHIPNTRDYNGIGIRDCNGLRLVDVNLKELAMGCGTSLLTSKLCIALGVTLDGIDK